MPSNPPASTRPPLTDLQQKVLDYLTIFLRENHQLPTLAALASDFSWASQNAALTHVLALKKKGYLTRNELGNWRLTSEIDVHPWPADLRDAQLQLLADMLDPDALGYATLPEVRRRVLAALGRPVNRSAA